MKLCCWSFSPVIKSTLLFLLTALLGGCASIQKCQEFHGWAFDITTLVASSDGKDIFAGGVISKTPACFPGLEGVGKSAAVYRSSDKGTTWRGGVISIQKKYQDVIVTSLATFPDDSIFAAIALKPVSFFNKPWEGVLYRYHANSGWKEIRTEFDNAYIQSIAAGKNSTLFAAICGVGICRSRDHGDTWTCTDLREPPLGQRTCWSKVIADGGGSIYAHAQGPNGIGLYRSIDNGSSWHRLPVRAGETIHIASNSRGSIVIASSTAGWNIFLYQSNDFGETWQKITPPDGSFVDELALGKNKTIFLITRGFFSGGAFRSFDEGKSWEEVQNWPIGHGVYLSTGLVADHDGVLFTGMHGLAHKSPRNVYGGEVFRSFDHGSTWEIRHVLPSASTELMSSKPSQHQ